jgi:primase-polymerase (primpol)-like protein
VGDGFGVMLGDGLGCWDLDHCIEGDVVNDAALAVLGSVETPLWVERSVSGTGLHVFVKADEAPGRKMPGVEFYSRARFIRVTGDGFTMPSMLGRASVLTV